MSNNFSIYKHILDHDFQTFKVSERESIELTELEREKFKGTKYNRNDIENFIVSFDPIQFKSFEAMKENVKNYIDKLSKHNFSRTYNKTYTNKNGEDKIYNYERIGTFENSIISVHLNTDNPHIHIIFNKKSKDKSFGKNYSTLKRDLNKFDKELNVITTSSRDKFEDGKDISFKQLENELTKFSWALEKNKSMSSFKTKSISLENIEIKLNEYISKNGSYNFALKIKNTLFEKGYINDITLQKSKEQIYLSKQIENNNYRNISIKFMQDCKKSKPMNIEIRNFIKAENKNDFEVSLKEKLLDIYKDSNFTYSHDMKEKNIDIKKLNIYDNELKKSLETYEKEKYLNIKNTKYLSEQFLKKELSSINYNYKSFEEESKKSISKHIFENNFEYMKDVCKTNNLENIQQEIKELNQELSDKYVKMISEKILEERLDKELYLER